MWKPLDFVQRIRVSVSEWSARGTDRIVELQRIAGGANHRALDHVLEFANVTGPVVLLKRGHHRLRHLGDPALEVRAEVDE